MDISRVVEILANGVVGSIGACIGAAFTLWLQARQQLITRIDDETLRVDIRAFRKDGERYAIPGYGWVINPESLHKELQKPKKKQRHIGFVCVDRTASDGSEKEYVISRIVPS